MNDAIDKLAKLEERMHRMELRVEGIEATMRTDQQQHNEMADMLDNMNAVLVEFREVISAYKTIQSAGKFVAWFGNGAKWLVQTAVALGLIWAGFKLAVNEQTGELLKFIIGNK